METPIAASEETEKPHLRHSEILRFYVPLAASWLFMAIEGPVAVAVIGRLPDSQVNLAALLIVFALSLWIESPVIDLLATSTTLARNRQHFLVLQRFAAGVILVVTAVHILVAWTPLFWFIAYQVLDLPQPVAESARTGMLIMVPWSGLIGWRRYLQGVLIRYGRTRLVGIGTLMRVCTMAVTAFGLHFGSTLPGIVIASISLVASVGSEAIFIHVASRPLIREKFSEDADSAPPLTFRRLFKFHMPLTATTMVMLTSMPVVGAALARAPDSVLQMASWQVAFTLLFLHRTIVFALPEVVITLYKDEQSAAKLRRFCLGVGAFASGTLLVVVLTGLDMGFFRNVVSARPDTAAWAHVAFLASALMPLLGAMQSYMRGVLTAHHLTFARLLSVLVAMGSLLILLVVLVALDRINVVTAALALTAAMMAEYAALAYSWKLGSRMLERS